jgi:RNA recognition motif-containing protein
LQAWIRVNEFRDRINEFDDRTVFKNVWDQRQGIERIPSMSAVGDKRTLFVGNLSFSLTEADLMSTFSPFGKIVSVRIPTDEQGRSKGFGFVEFENDEGAQKAVREMNEKEVGGRAISVSLHCEDPRDFPSKGARPKAFSYLKCERGLEVPQYSESQIAAFENTVLARYNRRFPRLLRELFLGRLDIRTIKVVPPIEDSLHCFARMSEEGIRAREMSVEHLIRGMERGITSPSPTAVPFGLDPGGNVFWADELDQTDVIWFYDHESDDSTMFEVVQ